MTKILNKLKNLALKQVQLEGKDVYMPLYLSKSDYLDRKANYDSKYYTKATEDGFYLIKREKGAVILVNDIAKAYIKLSNDTNNIFMIYDENATHKYIYIATLSSIDDKYGVVDFVFKKDKFEQRELIKVEETIKILLDKEKKLIVLTHQTQALEEENFYIENKNQVEILSQSVSNEILQNTKLTEPNINKALKLIATVVLFVFISNIVISILDTSGAKLKNANDELKKVNAQISALNNQLETIKKDKYYSNQEYYAKLKNKEVYR